MGAAPPCAKARDGRIAAVPSRPNIVERLVSITLSPLLCSAPIERIGQLLYDPGKKYHIKILYIKILYMKEYRT